MDERMNRPTAFGVAQLATGSGTQRLPTVMRINVVDYGDLDAGGILLERGINGHIKLGINGHFKQGINGRIDQGIKGCIDQGIKGHIDQGINGYIEYGINGHFEQGINGHFEQGINGHFEQGINGHFEQGINGHFKQGINGHFEQGINGHFKQGINGCIDRGINGHFEQRINGCIDQEINGRIDQSDIDQRVRHNDDTYRPVGNFNKMFALSGAPDTNVSDKTRKRKSETAPGDDTGVRQKLAKMLSKKEAEEGKVKASFTRKIDEEPTTGGRFVRSASSASRFSENNRRTIGDDGGSSKLLPRHGTPPFFVFSKSSSCPAMFQRSKEREVPKKENRSRVASAASAFCRRDDLRKESASQDLFSDSRFCALSRFSSGQEADETAKTDNRIPSCDSVFENSGTFRALSDRTYQPTHKPSDSLAQTMKSEEGVYEDDVKTLSVQLLSALDGRPGFQLMCVVVPGGNAMPILIQDPRGPERLCDDVTRKPSPRQKNLSILENPEMEDKYGRTKRWRKLRDLHDTDGDFVGKETKVNGTSVCDVNETGVNDVNGTKKFQASVLSPVNIGNSETFVRIDHDDRNRRVLLPKHPLTSLLPAENANGSPKSSGESFNNCYRGRTVGLMDQQQQQQRDETTIVKNVKMHRRLNLPSSEKRNERETCGKKRENHRKRRSLSPGTKSTIRNGHFGSLGIIRAFYSGMQEALSSDNRETQPDGDRDQRIRSTDRSSESHDARSVNNVVEVDELKRASPLDLSRGVHKNETVTDSSLYDGPCDRLLKNVNDDEPAECVEPVVPLRLVKSVSDTADCTDNTDWRNYRYNLSSSSVETASNTNSSSRIGSPSTGRDGHRLPPKKRWMRAAAYDVSRVIACHVPLTTHDVPHVEDHVSPVEGDSSQNPNTRDDFAEDDLKKLQIGSEYYNGRRRQTETMTYPHVTSDIHPKILLKGETADCSQLTADIHDKIQMQEHPPSNVECLYLAIKPDDDGDLPLHLAVAQGSDALVAKLLVVMSHLRVSVDSYNLKRQTGLHLAVISNQPKMVTMLLKASASPNVCDCRGNSSLHLAVKYQSLPCLESLLMDSIFRVNLDEKNYEGLTALHMAVQSDQLDMARSLLTDGAGVNVADGTNGRTPLHYAAETDNVAMVTVLLQHRANPCIATYSGWTPGQIATAKSFLGTAKLLERCLFNSADGIVSTATNRKILRSKEQKIC